jgi:hypothetical protein
MNSVIIATKTLPIFVYLDKIGIFLILTNQPKNADKNASCTPVHSTSDGPTCSVNNICRVCFYLRTKMLQRKLQVTTKLKDKLQDKLHNITSSPLGTLLSNPMTENCMLLQSIRVNMGKLLGFMIVFSLKPFRIKVFA